MAETKKVVALPRTLATKAKAATPGSNQDRGSAIPRERATQNFESVRQLRDVGQLIAAIRRLATVDGTTSASVFSMVQVANSGYKIMAFDSASHEFSQEGTLLARSIRASMDTLYDYTKGYADKKTFADIVETGLREVTLTSGLGAELVLDKQRLPDRINLVPYEQIEWVSRGDGTKYPKQKATGGDIELNIPNFWVAESHLETNTAYSRSMLEASLHTIFYYLEFVEDMRRAVRRSGHTRLIVKLDAEKVQAAAPPEVQQDPVKLQAFMEQVKDKVETVINALEPDDALIAYDSVTVDPIETKGEKQDYKELLTTLSGILATSLKSHPSILGLRLTGSQSLSNTESLVFLKIARAIQKPLEKVLSRALTLAVRLYGVDVYVKFRFKTIDIRPESELEAFRIMRQDRVLELLSIGMMTDEQAAEELDTQVPPGMTPLSGTFFKEMSGGSAFQRDLSDTVSPNADPQGRALQSPSPKKAGGDSQ